LAPLSLPAAVDVAVAAVDVAAVDVAAVLLRAIIQVVLSTYLCGCFGKS